MKCWREWKLRHECKHSRKEKHAAKSGYATGTSQWTDAGRETTTLGASV